MSDVQVKSYRYLRTAMVGLLIALAAAVFYQAWRQGFHLLSSVSAYYYTPAQAIFVGALIGLAACMIALRGTTGFEDVVLNLGGMFAAVVAVVPTSRGSDFDSALSACQQTAAPPLTRQGSGGFDCPTVQALYAATKANVQNNMAALLVVGFLGLVATVLFAYRDARVGRLRRFGALLWWGLGASFLLWALGLVGVLARLDWFVRNAHFIAAIGLFVSIVAVAVANAVRRQRPDIDKNSGVRQTLGATREVLTRKLGLYSALAWAMVGVGAVQAALFFANVITLFWVEVPVALMFALFWMVQTVELADA
jgi:hypothetical protein